MLAQQRALTPFLASLGLEIRVLLHLRGMSMADLQRATGMAPGTIMNLAWGIRDCSMDKLIVVAGVLHVPVAQILQAAQNGVRSGA